MADNLLKCMRMPSHTSFNPIACKGCTQSSATIRLHKLKVRACSSTAYLRASYATRWPGMYMHICCNVLNFDRDDFMAIVSFAAAVPQRYD